MRLRGPISIIPGVIVQLRLCRVGSCVKADETSEDGIKWTSVVEGKASKVK